MANWSSATVGQVLASSAGYRRTAQSLEASRRALGAVHLMRHGSGILKPVAQYFRRVAFPILLCLIPGSGIEEAVSLFADRGEQIELGLEKVDVALLVFEQILEQVHGHVVTQFLADLA